MKKLKFLTPTMLIILSIIIQQSHAQLVFVKYELSGIAHRYPILKIEGDNCFINNNENNISWTNVSPFYVSETGDLYDANQLKIGWYHENSFYLMDGWVVLDNKKSYYSHKEMIYSKEEITGRLCSGQRFWFVAKADGITYLQQAENKRNNIREDGFSFELVGLSMNKKIAVAIFWRFKLIQHDLGPCGFGTADDRGELFSKLETAEEIQIQKQKEQLARIEKIEKELAIEEARKKDIERKQDSIRLLKEKEENANIQMINGIKSKAFTKTENDFVGNWEFKSDKIYTKANEIIIFEEFFYIYPDRTYSYKSFFRKWLEKTIYKEYNEKGIWEIKDNMFFAYTNDEDGKPSKQTDTFKFDELSIKKASRTIIITQDIPPIKMKGKKTTRSNIDNNTLNLMMEGAR